MPEENNNNQQNPPELNLEEVIQLEPDKLTAEHKTFLEENKTNLTPEQAQKYGIKQEDNTPIDPNKVEIPTRYEIKATKKKDGEEEDSEVDPDDAKTIEKIVDKKTADLRETTRTQQDAFEVNALIGAQPEFAKYKDVILKYMKHPAYSNIPAASIALMVAGNELQKIGAQKEREAQKKALETHQKGSTFRKPTGSKVDWHNASKEEYQAKLNEVMQMRRD